MQGFEANEYVAACFTATIECMYPGNGQTNGQEEYGDYNGQQSGWWYEDDNKTMPHGACGTPTTLTVNSSNMSGYETTGRAIYNIRGWNGTAGTFTCTWNSYYGSEYNHRGRVIVTAQDPNHPNRS